MSTKANLMCAVPPRQRPPQGPAASKHAAARLRRLRPCPGRSPAALEMEVHMPKLGPDRHKSSPLQHDALTRIDKVERAIIEIMHGAS